MTMIISAAFHQQQPDHSLYHKIGWAVAVLLAIALAGCGQRTADDPLADHSFLTQQPCASPCWYGLEPNKSTASDIKVTLPKLSFVNPATITEGETSWLGVDGARQLGFDCLHPKNSACGGSLFVFHDQLKKVTLNVIDKLTFRQAVDVLNQPDQIDSRPFSPDGGGCVIALIWSKRGIYITSIEPQNESHCQMIRQAGHVDPNVAVTTINYVSLEGFTPGPKSYFPEAIPWPGFSG